MQMTGSLFSPAVPTMTLHTASTLLENFPLPPALALFVVNVQKGKCLQPRMEVSLKFSGNGATESEPAGCAAPSFPPLFNNFE